jgi:hypothetical protein
MENLGNFFPEDMKNQLADDNFKIGMVLKYMHPDIPKTKRYVVVGFDSRKVYLALLVINSEINENVFSNPFLRDLNVELDAESRDYLDHTSYVNCSKILEDDAAKLKQSIIDEPSVHIGEFSKEDLETVIEKIKTAPTVSLKKKKKFGIL